MQARIDPHGARDLQAGKDTPRGRDPVQTLPQRRGDGLAEAGTDRAGITEPRPIEARDLGVGERVRTASEPAGAAYAPTPQELGE